MTVFIVDDEEPVRKAVGRLLRSAGFAVEAFASPGEFLVSYNPGRSGCLILDMAMPGFNGLELQKTLTETGNELPIIFLTGHADVPMCVQAMKQGAADFLIKPVKDSDLFPAVHRALEHNQLFRHVRQEQDDIQVRLARLTPREREVLEHIVTGQLNKQIASDLGAAEKTIKIHRSRVMEKMMVKSVAELVTMMGKI